MVTAGVLVLSQPFSEDACVWLREIAREKFQQSSVSISPRPLLHRRLSIIAVPLCGSTVSLISFLKNEKKSIVNGDGTTRDCPSTCRLRARTLAGSRNLVQLFLAIDGVPHFHKIDCDVDFPSPPSCHDILSGILQDPTKIVSPSNESIFDRTQNDRRATCSPESFPTLSPPRPRRKAVKIRNWEMGAVQWRASWSP